MGRRGSGESSRVLALFSSLDHRADRLIPFSFFVFLELKPSWKAFSRACTFLLPLFSSSPSTRLDSNLTPSLYPFFPSNRVRERLKTVLRQYELRETQFEAILRSKELEVLLSKARSEE